jgi:TonB family protein
VVAPDLSSTTTLAEALLEGASVPTQPEEPAPPPSLPKLEIESEFGLERRVAFAPPPPRLQIQHPADVRIQFWVSPRGEVTNASPIQRGDPALDSAAIDYVKKFRFTPLPSGEQQVQWGTLRVKFRLE